MRAESGTSTSARTAMKLAEHETSTYANRQTNSQKLEAKEVQTVRIAVDNRPQGASFESASSAMPQVTNSSNTRLYLSSNCLMNSKDILFDEADRIALFSAHSYKIEGTVEITRKIQIPTLFLLDMGAGPNLIPKSVNQLSWQSHIWY